MATREEIMAEMERRRRMAEQADADATAAATGMDPRMAGGAGPAGMDPRMGGTAGMLPGGGAGIGIGTGTLPDGTGSLTGRYVPVAGSSGSAPEREIRAVRTEEENAAYRMGERDGARMLMGMSGAAGGGGTAPGAGLPVNEERIREAERTLMKYKNGKASVDRRIIHAQQWWKIRNWQEIEAKQGTRGATAQKNGTAWLWNCIVGKHADAIDSYPEPVILPRMQDDKEEAKRLSDIVPVVMQINGFEETYSLASWQKFQEGTAAYGCFWDKNKLNGMGDISIRKVNVLNLFWEPGITDIQESRNLFYITMMDNDQLEGMYPQLQGKLKAVTLTVNKYLTDDSAPTEGKSAVVDWYYKKWEGPRQVLHYCKFVGENILYSTENNGEPGLYADGNYPFVLDPLFPVEGQPTGYGYIDIGEGAQIDIDKLNQAMVQNAVANSTPRFFIRKDGGVNEEEFADFSKPFIHTNGNLGQDSIMPIVATSLQAQSVQMLQSKIDELKFITGNTDINNGGTPSGVTAASAIAALKEDSGRSSKDSTKAAYRAYAKLVTMVIERIRQFYDIPRQFRILGQRGQEEFVNYSNAGIVPQAMPGGLGMEDSFRLPAFDIDVRAQRENAYTKMSQNELAVQFYQMGIFNPQMTDQALMCLDMMEFKGKEEIQQKVEAQGTLQQAMMQVGQIALALAQKYEPQVAEQLGAILQSVAMDAGAPAAAGGAGENTANAMGGADAQDPGKLVNENPIVTRAKERAQNATRPS